MPDFQDSETQAIYEAQLERFKKNPKIRSPETLARMVAIRKAKKKRSSKEPPPDPSPAPDTPKKRPWYDWEPL